MEATSTVTGIILTGGESSRFGSPKAAALFGGRPMLQCIADALATVCGALVVVRAAAAEPPELRAAVDLRHARDRFAGQGPLAGIVAGMQATTSTLCFVTACDAPLLQPSLVTGLAAQIGRFDAVCPRVAGRNQPLTAVYRIPAALPAFENALAAGRLRVSACVEELNVRFLDDDELRKLDARLDSFRTANTPEELAALEAYANAISPRP